MRLRRWGGRCLIGRHDRRDGWFKSLMTHVTRSALTVNLKTAKALGIRSRSRYCCGRMR